MTVTAASGKLNEVTLVKIGCFKSTSIIIRNRFLFRNFGDDFGFDVDHET